MSNQLDTRDLQEELEELENLKADHELAKETLEEAEKALEDYQENERQNDNDVEQEETILRLEKDIEDAEEELTAAEDALDSDKLRELEELQSLKDEVGSEWEYGVQLIPEDDFVEYCQELCEDIGDIPKNIPSYIVIDWDATSNNLRQDYSETEFRGETYLYRA